MSDRVEITEPWGLSSDVASYRVVLQLFALDWKQAVRRNRSQF
jgi:hypothetical protein